MIVSYFTENYRKEADKLIKSLKRNEISYVVKELSDQGGWDKNTHYKPIFLLEMMQLGFPYVVWTDADSEVIKPPTLFDTLDCDVAFHRFQGTELLSGTVFLNNTPKTIELLNKWIEVNNQNPTVFDQKNLDTALSLVPDLTIGELPPEYCFIYDLSFLEYGDLKPVFMHWQASRKLKKKR